MRSDSPIKTYHTYYRCFPTPPTLKKPSFQNITAVVSSLAVLSLLLVKSKTGPQATTPHLLFESIESILKQFFVFRLERFFCWGGVSIAGVHPPADTKTGV